MRGRVAEIRETGAQLVLIGNGTPQQAALFSGADDSIPVYTDPSLNVHRIVGARRGRLGILDPRVLLSSLRALKKGFRQTEVLGDPLQLGGALVILPGGVVAYSYMSRFAGDHPPPEEILGALRRSGVT